MKSLLRACFITAAVAFAAPAQAACTQANIAGSWNIYAVVQNNNGYLDWVACGIVINASGAFTKAACRAADTSSSAASGALKIFDAPDCVFSGTITIKNTHSTYQLRSIAMTMDKQSAIGVGGGYPYGSAFNVNMVKVK